MSSQKIKHATKISIKLLRRSTIPQNKANVYLRIRHVKAGEVYRYESVGMYMDEWKKEGWIVGWMDG